MNLIVAVDKNWGIGKDGKLLANLPGDMKNFREKTQGKTVVMGRSTLESLPGGKPLPNRTNIVLTHNQDFKREGCIIVHDMQELLEELNNYHSEDVMIMGGASVYNELIPYCDALYITKIDYEFDADTHIKNVDELPGFKVVWQSDVMEDNGYQYRFLEYRRVAHRRK